MKRWPINLGQIISNNIVKMEKDDKTVLGNVYVIHMLCLEQLNDMSVFPQSWFVFISYVIFAYEFLHFFTQLC